MSFITSTTSEKNKENSKKYRLLSNLNCSESEIELSEHELFYYKNDKIKMMKEVLKILKPKKIKSMAPDCIKHLDIEEINAMLLEELLGISNKRLTYIFNGENPDRVTSSSESDDEKVVEIISLDDISEDDIEITIEKDDKSIINKEIYKREKKRHKTKSIKSEKSEKSKRKKKKLERGEEKLMSVLELLELQARARAIRSQLALEAAKRKEQEEMEKIETKVEEATDDEDAVIFQSPKRDEIVIESTDDEQEQILNINKNTITTLVDEKPRQKVKIIRDWSVNSSNVLIDNLNKKNREEKECLNENKEDQGGTKNEEFQKTHNDHNNSECGDEIIVINLEEDEIHEMEHS